MKIGIFGYGRIGGSLAKLWQKAGHEVMVAGHDADRAHAAADAAGARSGTLEETARFGDVAVLAVPWSALAEVIGAVGGALGGKIVIDSTNAYGDASIPVDPGLSHSENVAHALPESHLVKAFNMINWKHLADRGDGADVPRFAVFASGDDANARALVIRLIEETGFAAIDAGALANGRMFEKDAVLYAKDLLPDAARAALPVALREPAHG